MTKKQFVKVGALLLVAGLLLVTLAVAAADDQVTHYTGTEGLPSAEACDAAGGLGGGEEDCVLAFIQPPTFTPNGKQMRAARIGYYRDETTDPRTTGYTTVEAHLFANMETRRAHIWGTWRVLTDIPAGSDWAAGSGWEGTWNGQTSPDGTFVVATAEGTGSFEGLRLRMRMENGEIEGLIVE